MDFAENYHYVVLDEIQGYLRNKDQCTAHVVVIYFKKDDLLHHFSLCIISDDPEQDTCFVHELQRIVMLYIKKNLPQIKSVDYFSDSCAGQYKNCKAVLILCHHKSDIDGTWTVLQQDMGNLSATELLAQPDTRYFVPVCRDLLIIKC